MKAYGVCWGRVVGWVMGADCLCLGTKVVADKFIPVCFEEAPEVSRLISGGAVMIRWMCRLSLKIVRRGKTYGFCCCQVAVG